MEKEQLLYLKELGFNYDNSKSNQTVSLIYRQLFRWFRERHNWQASIEATSDQHSHNLGYNYWIWNHKTGEEYHTMPKNRPSGDWEFETYEEAELACLIKLIEIIKQNKTDEELNLIKLK
jgi:uncharacterized protein RhaS with RHS repeats